MPLELQGYTTKEILHQGKKFTIYRGIRNADQKKVILKICRFEQPSLNELTTLQHEYQILRQLKLPGVIRVYDLIRFHYQLILVLEDMGGQSLKEFLAQHKIPLNLFFEIALQLVNILSSLHLQNIIHKDINPSNILIDPSSLKVKLADFSISTKLSRQTEEPAFPQNLSGTLAYISPEQTGRMNRSIDYRTDFYSLGVTFYEMLTGELPFSTQDPLEIIHSHLAKSPISVHEKNPEVPEMLSAIVTKLLSKMPEERYTSTTGLKSDLLECKLQWASKLTISPFTLAKHDISDQLMISQKLYGREKKVNQLLEAFYRVSNGSTELLTVSGYSGIGKTSLVNEIYKPILYKRGYLVTGKYDQLQRATPYSAIIEAFEMLTRRLLMESNLELLEIKESILKLLKNNAQLIVNVIPMISLIIGEQPPVSELPAAEAQNRFMMTFKNFVHALARPNHPLVVFLDDLQWIDNASLQLLKLLLTDEELRYILIIGAYRNNEVPIEHPLMLLLDQLKKSETPITHLTLGPLEKMDIQNLLSDSLNGSLEEVEEISELFSKKTRGNPFFINEFLKKLYQDKLLEFCYKTHQWKWDVEKIKKQPITENVVDLLIHRIQQLPENVTKLLKLASCIGHVFDLYTLAIICEQKLNLLVKDIEKCLKENLIVPVGESYLLLDSIILNIIPPSDKKIEFRFIHDRVQQASYQLIPEEEKQTFHLKIGRLLLKENIKNHLLEKDDQLLFKTLDHFNKSISLMTELSEKHELANLNLLAGRKAKTSVAYEAALIYLGSGLKLLKPDDWNKDYSILFNLYKEMSECLFFLKKFEEGNQYIEKLLTHTTDNIQKSEVYLVKIRAYVYSAKHQEALNLGYKALNILSFYLPRKVRIISVIKEIILIKWKTRKKDNEKYLFETQDIRFLTISKILASMFPSAFQLDQNLFAYITCKLIRFSLKFGYTPDTSFAFLAYAIVLISAQHHIDEAFYAVSLSKALEKLLGKRIAYAKNYVVMGDFIVPWKYPLSSALEYLEKAHNASIEEGDLAYGNYSQFKSLMLYYLGKPLPEVKENVEKSINFLRHTGDQDFYNYFLFLKNIVLSLIKRNPESDAALNSILKTMKKSDNKTALAFIYSIYTQFLYIKGDFDKAFEISALVNELRDFTNVTFDKPYEWLFYGLCLAAHFHTTDRKTQIRSIKELKKIQKQFKKWSSFNSHDFLYKYLLISAEISQLEKGFTEETVRLYNQAILEVENKNYLFFLAIANECAARFYNNFNDLQVAKLYKKNAYYTYLKWGALEKCALLEKEYPDLTQLNLVSEKESPVSSTGTFNSGVDVLSIFKATQAISGEIQLEILLRKLIHILIENAGAQRGLLLTRDQNDWFVEAEGTTMDQKITLNRTQPIGNRTDISLSLIQYVQKTKELTLIQNIKELEPFLINDPYLNQVKPQSILVLPIFYQGALTSLLYLEHRDVNNAFTPSHLQTLKLLASQASISLENARLYHQATHDPLTGLANRNLLYQIFNHTLPKAKRENKIIAILFLDLDQFKKINDTLGHEIGDKALLIFSELLKTCLREEDFPSRFGGDEFIILLENTSLTEINTVVQRILNRLMEPFTVSNHKLYLSTSIGISLYPNDGTNIQELIKQADIALYRAKELGKSRYQFFMAELNQKLQEDNAKEIELRKALETNQFCLYYQPILKPKTHELIKIEALIRWKHPNGNLLLPGEFIPIAEKTGLMLQIGEWVLTTVCEQLNIWKSKGLKIVPIAINISGIQFKKQNILKLIQDILQRLKINPSHLELEFTESVFIEHSDKLVSDMTDLKKLGIKLVIDDFGTYYSSLSYLSRLSVDGIKIDRSFIYDIEKSEENKKLIIAIIAMARSLNLQTIAEGIETKEQIQFLEEKGVDGLQGFYLSKPLSVEECELLLKKPIDFQSSL